MEKINLKIEDFEDKKGQASGKRYTRFKTSEGWMSAFDKDLIVKLKEHEGKEVSVTIAVDEEKGFKNLRKFHGLATEETEKVEEKTETPIKKTQGFNPQTMYVSYAKDIFCALYVQGANPKNIMDNCIELIKQAKEEFN